MRCCWCLRSQADRDRAIGPVASCSLFVNVRAVSSSVPSAVTDDRRRLLRLQARVHAASEVHSSPMLTIARAGIWQGVVHSPTAWVFTFVLVVVFPVVDYLLYFRLNSKLGLYAWNILAEWSLVAWCIWIIRRNGLTLADLAEGWGSPLRLLAVSGVLVVIVVVVGIVSKSQAKKANPEQLRKATSAISRLLPLTSTERKVWVPLSFTAGVCEEFLFRGWLLQLIGAVFGSVWIGLVLSSIVFGFAHSYQGRKGIIGTGILGVVFGGIFVLSRSLLPGQLLHSFMDLKNGYAFGKIASRTENTPDS